MMIHTTHYLTSPNNSKANFITMSTIIGKVIMGFVSLVALWNLSKVPFYLAFNNDGNDCYSDSTGVELSINLGHWFEVSVVRISLYR